MRTPAHALRVLRALARRVVRIDEQVTELRGEERTARGDAAADAHAARDHRDTLARRTAEALSRTDEQVTRLRAELDQVRRDAHLAARRSTLTAPVLRVVMLVHNPSAWAGLHEVHALMSGAKDFDVTVLTMGSHQGGLGELRGEEVVHEALQARGVPHLRCPEDRDPLDLLRVLDPDLVFRQSQWDADIDPRLGAEHLGAFRTCLVPYEPLNAIHNPDAGETLDTGVDSEFHHRAWLVFTPRFSAERAAAIGRRGGAQFRAVGHPKVDVLRAATPTWPLSGEFPRIVLSTHHSLSDTWNNFGLLDQVQGEFLRWAREGDHEFVWSPHPYLVPFVRSGQAKISREELRAWRDQWDALANTATALDAGYPALIAASDVVVTDGISMLLEAQAIGKPVVFLERSDHVPFNAAGRRILQGVHPVGTMEQAREVVASLLRDGDPLRATQDQVVTDLLGPPGAAERIVEAIREQARRDGWRPI